MNRREFIQSILGGAGVLALNPSRTIFDMGANLWKINQGDFMWLRSDPATGLWTFAGEEFVPPYLHSQTWVLSND